MTHLHAQNAELSTQHPDLLARLRKLHACAPQLTALHGHVSRPRKQLALTSDLLTVHDTQRTGGVLPAGGGGGSAGVVVGVCGCAEGGTTQNKHGVAKGRFAAGRGV